MSGALWSDKLSCNGSFLGPVRKPERKKAGGLSVLHEVVRSAARRLMAHFAPSGTSAESLSPRRRGFISVMSLVSHWETVKWISGFFLSFLLVDGKAPTFFSLLLDLGDSSFRVHFDHYLWRCISLHSQQSPLPIRYQSNTASAVLETITNIQPKESGGGVGETREAIVYRLSEDMLSKLPPDYIPHEVSCTSPYLQGTGPLHKASELNASMPNGVFQSLSCLLISSSLSAVLFTLGLLCLAFLSILQIMVCTFSDTFLHFLSAPLSLSVTFSLPFSL